MGVDYSGVGGIGIELTDELYKKLIKAGGFSETALGDRHEFLYELEDKFKCKEAGDGALTGDEPVIYLCVPGDNLERINNNAGKFIEDFRKIGYTIETKDLLIIEDIYVY